MRRFSRLFSELDETNRRNFKVSALERYFRSVDSADGAWALYFLSGSRLRNTIKSALLRESVSAVSELPLWMVEECYERVGDLAETVALLLPEREVGTSLTLHEIVEERILPLKDSDERDRFECLTKTWNELNGMERFVYNKLLTGGFRVGVQKTLVLKALASVAGLEPAVLAHRIAGAWQPLPGAFENLLAKERSDDDTARPYPFYLAHPLEKDPAKSLGRVEEWIIEWKWDGIRAQLIKRSGQIMLWSRGEEMISDRFPEILTAGALLPEGIVLDGEVLAWEEGRPLPFGSLQKRIGRKNITARILKEIPTVFMAYDCLEFEGNNLCDQPLVNRRLSLLSALEGRGQDFPILPSPLVEENSWSRLEEIREESRSRGVEGFMLKRSNSPYRVGRVKGDWWKWKVDPFTIDAVFVYAQSGHGRRAGLFTDYTFAVWRGEELLPFAKAYSGLTDVEISQVDRFVRQNTLERFGPVRVVRPVLVFEIAFDGLQRSKRHKSGLAVRFPRISRWRTDKKSEDADTVETVAALLPG